MWPCCAAQLEAGSQPDQLAREAGSCYDWRVLHSTDRYEERMETVTVSPKYQVVIPAKVRRSLGIKPGQKGQVIQYEGRIELIPLVPLKKAKGFLRGIDTKVKRELDRAWKYTYSCLWLRRLSPGETPPPGG